MNRGNSTLGRAQWLIKEERICYGCRRIFQPGRKMLYSYMDLQFHPKGTHLCVSCNQIMHQWPDRVMKVTKVLKDEIHLRPGYISRFVESCLCKSPEEVIDSIVEWAALTPTSDLAI